MKISPHSSEKVLITAGVLLLSIIVVGLGVIIWKLLGAQEVLTKDNAALGARVSELAAEVRQEKKEMGQASTSSAATPVKETALSDIVPKSSKQGVRFLTRAVPTLTLGAPYMVYWVASSSIGEVFLSVEQEGLTYPIARLTSSTAQVLAVTSELPSLSSGEYYEVYEWDAGATRDGNALGVGEGYRISISHQGFEEENAEDSSEVFSLVE